MRTGPTSIASHRSPFGRVPGLVCGETIRIRKRAISRMAGSVVRHPSVTGSGITLAIHSFTALPPRRRR